MHGSVIATHFREYWLFGIFFLVLAPLQLGWAALVLRRPADRRLLLLGGLANLAVVSLWIVTRTVGLPFGPEPGKAEAVHAADVIASVDELAIAVLVGALLARRRIPWAAMPAWGLVASSVIVALLGSHGGSEREGPSASFRLAATLPARPAPVIRLPEARGGALDTARMGPYVVTFLYSHCHDVCPLIGDEIGAALRRMGPAGRRLPVVAVSVDPGGDTPTAVRAWLAKHHEPANFHYLIGSRRRLAPIWRAWSAKPEAPGEPVNDHSAVIWLVDRRSQRVGSIAAGAPIRVADLAHDFGQLLGL